MADPDVGPTVPPAKFVFERAEGTGRVLNSLVCAGATICEATAQVSAKISPDTGDRR